MTLAVNKIDEEDKSRKAAILARAVEALMTLEPQELSAEELISIREVAGAAKRALKETQYPLSFPPGMDAVVSKKSAHEEDTKIKDAASHSGIIQQKRQSIFDLSSKKTVKSENKSIESKKTIEVLQKAEKILLDKKARVDKGDLLVEELSEALDTPEETILQEAIETAAPHRKFPNLAQELLNFGLQNEKNKTEQLAKHKLEVEKHQNSIQKLLQLRGLLPTDIKEPLNLQQAVLSKLTGAEREEIQQCIQEVFPKESYDITKITKEQLTVGLTQITDLMGQHKTEMTNLLSTKISVIINNLQSLTQFMQSIFRLDDRLKEKIIEKSVSR